MMKKTIFGLSLTVFGLGAALAQQPAMRAPGREPAIEGEA